MSPVLIILESKFNFSKGNYWERIKYCSTENVHSQWLSEVVILSGEMFGSLTVGPFFEAFVIQLSKAVFLSQSYPPLLMFSSSLFPITCSLLHGVIPLRPCSFLFYFCNPIIFFLFCQFFQQPSIDVVVSLLPNPCSLSPFLTFRYLALKIFVVCPE